MPSANHVRCPLDLEQLRLRDVGRVDELVARLLVAQPRVVLHQAANEPALGVEDREPRSDLVGEREEVELVPEPAVVAPLGLLESMQVRVEVVLARPGRAVDAGELRVPFVAAPVGAGDVRQLEGAEHPGVRHVRAEAQVGPVAVRVQRDGVAGGRLSRATVPLGVADAFDDLDLEGLVREPLERLGARDLLAHERLPPLHDLAHPRSIVARSLGMHVLGELEVVVEAVGDRRADRVLRARVEVAHRLGEHVRGRVPQHVEPVVGPCGRPARRSASAGGTNDRSRSSPSTRAAIVPFGSAAPTGSPSGSSTERPSGRVRVGMRA